MENESVNFDDLLSQEDATIEPDVTHIDEFNSVDANEGDSEEPSTEPEETEEDSVPDYSSDAMYSFLQSHGVKDPSKIQISDEDGKVEEIDFKTLSPEEQLDVLNELTNPGLTEDEINTVNYLRRNRVTMQNVMDAYAQQYLEAYLSQNPDRVKQRTYEIDDYSDDDLYIVDLKRRYPDFTDSEILDRLDSAKENQELYKKETEILRKAYKDQEDRAVQDQVLAEQQAAEDLRNNLINAAVAFNEVQLDYTDDKSDSLVIEDGDKQQMISYILAKDTDGKSQLIKDLENPDALIELAWLRTQGKEVLSNISKYWKGVLADERAENKRLRSQLEKANKNNPTVVVSHKKTANADINSFWDDAI